MMIKMNQLERIGRILGISTNMDESRLCLTIQDKIKEKDSKLKEKDFCYYMVKAQNERLESEVHNLKNEFAESIGIGEHMMLKNSHESLKKNNKNLLEENYNLRTSIEQYRENDLKDRIKKIQGVR